MPNKFRLEFIDSGSTAELIVYGRIGLDWWGEGVDAKQIAKDLLSSSARTIKVRINSGGGSAFDGIAIYNALVRHSARIEVSIDGQAGSAASIIAMAADELTMPTGSFLWIHNAWSVAVGEAKNMRKVADQLDQINGEVAKIYARKSGLDEAEIVEMMNEDTWFSPADAKAKGFADIIDSDTEVDAYAYGNVAVFAGVEIPRERVPEGIFKTLRPVAGPKPAAQKEAEIMDMEKLKKEHPELYASIRKEAAEEAEASAREAGAQAERERIAGIEDVAVPGFEDLVAAAKADPKASGATLAMDIAKAIKAKGKSYLASLQADAAELSDVAIEPTRSAHDPAEETAKAERESRIQAGAQRLAAISGTKVKEVK